MSTPNNRGNKNGGRKDNQNQPKFNSILPIAVLAILMVLFFNYLVTSYQKAKTKEINYNEFKQMLEEDEIAETEIQSDQGGAGITGGTADLLLHRSAER